MKTKLISNYSIIANKMMLNFSHHLYIVMKNNNLLK